MERTPIASGNEQQPKLGMPPLGREHESAKPTHAVWLDGWRGLAPWLPFPFLLLIMVVLWAANLRTAYESPYLLTVLNLVFSTLVSLVIAHLVGRSFLVRGTPGLLMLGCGVVIWGGAGFVGAVAGLMGASHGQDFADLTVTIHNSCVWLSALCHLAGATLSLRPRRVIHAAGLWLPTAYSASLGAVGVIALSALSGWLPTFFVQGQGGTPVRQLVLGSAIVMFTFTAVLLRAGNRRASSPFAYWYALALLLIAAGLFGVLIQPSSGSPLGWVGRATQYLSGVYMLIAAIASVRESRVWRISLEGAVSEARQQYGELFNLAADGVVVYELAGETGRVNFLQANPSICGLLGYSPQEMQALGPLDIMAPENRQAVPHDTETLIREHVLRQEITLIAKDGRRIPVEISSRLFQHEDRPTVMSIIRDITDRERTEEALRESEAVLRSFFDSPGVMRGIVELVDGEIVHASCNSAAAEMFGVDRDKISGTPATRTGVSEDVRRKWVELYEESRRTGNPVSMEYARRGADGKEYWLLATACYLGTGHSGHPRFAYTILDLTTHKRTEEALIESEAQFRALANAIPQLCWMGSADGSILWYNQRWYDYTGTTPEQVAGWGWQSVHDPELLPKVLERWKASIATGEPFDMVLPLRGADGVFRPFLTRVMPVLDGDGKIAGWFGTGTDISDQRKTEESLRDSEKRERARALELQALMDAAPAAILVAHDAECRYVSGNPMAYALLRSSPGSNLSKSAPDSERPASPRLLHHGVEVPPEELPVQKAAFTGQPVRNYELGLTFEDGTSVNLLGDAVPMLDENARPRGAVGVFVNTTDRKKIEEELAIAYDRLELAQQASGSGTWDWDVVTNRIEWSPRMFELFGLEPTHTAASFAAWEAGLHPEDKELAAAKIEEALRNHTPLDSEYRIVHPDGQVRWINAIGKGVYDQNNRPARMAGLCIDITERKLAEENLRQSEERYRTLFDTLIEGFCVIEVIFDAEGRPVDYRLLEINPAFEAQTGLKNARGRLIREIAPDNEAHWFEIYGRVALTGQPARFVNETRALNRWFDVSAYRVGGPDSRRVAILFNDITPRRRAEESILQHYQEARAEITRRQQVEVELRRSNADLEQFAFAISHDLRSPLNAITSFAKQLDEDYHAKLGADAGIYLNYITGASARLRRLISDLLVYSRVAETDQIKASVRDTQEALRAAELNLQEKIRQAGAVITHDPLPEVVAPAGLLTQVFQNLVENAIKFRGDATPRIHVSAERRGEEWLFCVSDNGIGIEPQHTEQVFRIFKRLHGDTFEGTGIGLAVCKKIVERQGGRIWVESTPGEGSRFYFALPALPQRIGEVAGG